MGQGDPKDAQHFHICRTDLNHLVNQRMGKHQPMRWSADGAHLLLQVRRAVIDGRLDELFRERYPMFRVMAPAVPTARMLSFSFQNATFRLS